MMNRVYLDNASTTQIRPEVIQTMMQVLNDDYGNPSSTHSFGRSAKSIVEQSRKTIANLLKATSQEIVFTSGGTEANNWILRSAVWHLNVQRIILSKVEHHAVLQTVKALQKEYYIQVDYVDLTSDGFVNSASLAALLSQDIKTMVSLMHVNNETGTILDIHKIGRICEQHQALFHSDTVQSIGKIPFDLTQLPVHFLVASAHKFHGPKGIGFAFIKKNSGLKPIFFGGEQEKGLRPGTEPVHQIAGMEKALKLAYLNIEFERNYILELKNYLTSQLKLEFPDVKFNGSPEGIPTILNVLLPFAETKTALILFNLDMNGISVSRGSACQSGSIKPSHVLEQLLSKEDLRKPSLRISLSHFNTKNDIDLLIKALKSI